MAPFTVHFEILTSSWRGQTQAIKQYWTIYGGYRALIGSPYLHIALVLSTICLWLWARNEQNEHIAKASDIAISAIPNLLGSTIGAFAIVLAFSSAEIFRILAEEGEPTSFFMKFTSNLAHLILIQVVAMVSGIIAKITESRMLDVVTLVFLMYAILATFSTAIQLFQTARIYSATVSLRSDDNDEDK